MKNVQKFSVCGQFLQSNYQLGEFHQFSRLDWSRRPNSSTNACKMTETASFQQIDFEHHLALANGHANYNK